MTREAFYESVRSVLAEVRPSLDVSAVDPDTHLWRDGIVDSLSMMEIVMHIEELLDIEIDLGENFLDNFTSIASMYDAYVARPGA